MRVVNTKQQTITEYDLTKGILVNSKILKEDAIPLGTIIETKDGDEIVKTKKIFWDRDDFEEVLMYIADSERPIEEQIDDLKSELSKSDYKIIKCYECQMANIEMPYDITLLHNERQILRDKINELESQL